MSSRLDPHTNLIFDLLNNQGRSFRAVCDTLLQHQIEITPQSLYSWYQRRRRKIAVRASYMGKVNFTDISPPEQGYHPTKKGASLATPTPAQKPIACTSLKAQIQKQEETLKTTPFSMMKSQLMVKPKTQDSSRASK